MTTRTCVGCGVQLEDDARFCHRCGVACAGPAACPACGAALDDDARFCPQCGAATTGAPAAAAGPAPGPAAASAPGLAPAPAPAPAANRLLSLVVLLLLGAILAFAAWSFTHGPQSGGAAGLPAAHAPVAETAPPAAQPAGEPSPHPEGAVVYPHGALAPPEGDGTGADGEPEHGTAGGGAPAAGPIAGPIAGTITIAPGLADKVKPGSVIFLIARPVGEGLQRPIAVAKIPLAAFPIPFSIGAENLMTGNWGGAVTISARLDQDSDAASKQPGDLAGEAKENPVQPGTTTVTVVLDRAL